MSDAKVREVLDRLIANPDQSLNLPNPQQKINLYEAQRITAEAVRTAVAAERERIAAWFSRAIVPTGIKSNHDAFRQDLYEFTESGDEEIIDIDATMQNIAKAIRSGRI